MVNIDWIKKTYPLHWLVWNDDAFELDRELATNQQHDKEKHDNRGRTPLMLSVTLGYRLAAFSLMHHNANVYRENYQGWSVVQESVGTGDPYLLEAVLMRSHYQKYCRRVEGIPELLHKLKQAPDFYVEMKWEFTSWVPLASRLCPSDTYKIYKQGSNVRIDTTLVGFENATWQRGNISFVFKGQNDGAMMMEVDHETRKVYVQHMKLIYEKTQLREPSNEEIMTRITNPIVTTYVDTDKISFERNKAGLWGRRSDKSETVNGHECKVFSANNVEVVTKTRLEHLSEADKSRTRTPRTHLQSFLRTIEQQDNGAATTSEEFTAATRNPTNITAEEYFDPDLDLNGRDIGKPKEVNTKIQKFKATLWLSEEYPLSLQEQIMPIVDLMAMSNSHFAKLKDFIQMQLPSGFPVKIEIPLFHVLNARITFGNIFGFDQEIPHVHRIQETDRTTCIVDDVCFEVPSGYIKSGTEDRSQCSIDAEDDLLQFAIQQSRLEAGSERDEVNIWEAMTANVTYKEQMRWFTESNLEMSERTNSTGVELDEEFDRKKRIERRRRIRQRDPERNDDGQDERATERLNELDVDSSEDTAEQLKLALQLSEQQQIEDEQRRRHLEEEAFRQVLELSLTDK